MRRRRATQRMNESFCTWCSDTSIEGGGGIWKGSGCCATHASITRLARQVNGRAFEYQTYITDSLDPYHPHKRVTTLVFKSFLQLLGPDGPSRCVLVRSLLTRQLSTVGLALSDPLAVKGDDIELVSFALSIECAGRRREYAGPEAASRWGDNIHLASPCQPEEW